MFFPKVGKNTGVERILLCRYDTANAGWKVFARQSDAIEHSLEDAEVHCSKISCIVQGETGCANRIQYLSRLFQERHVFAFESEAFSKDSGKRSFLVTSYEEFWHYYKYIEQVV